MSESQEQIKLIAWADAWFSVKFKELMCGDCAPLVAYPNEAKRTPREGARMKKQGLRPGMLDLELKVKTRAHRGLIIEMKYGSNKLTENQKKWIQWHVDNDYKVVVCYSFEAAMSEILHYMTRYSNDKQLGK